MNTPPAVQQNTAPAISPYTFSYLELRYAIGLLGLSLPIVLSLGAAVVFHTGIQESVSSYYYTRVGNVFVGVLFAIGFFLLSYRGLENTDRIASFLASLCAVIVGLFPTTPPHPAPLDTTIGHIHLGAAACLFATLAYFCLFLFNKTDQVHPTPRKLTRNRFYRGCGVTMLICLVLIFLYKQFWEDTTPDPLAWLRPVFWLESIMIFAFSLSWIIKGELILADEHGLAD